MTRYIFSSLWWFFFDYFSFIWLSFIFRFCGRSIFFALCTVHCLQFSHSDSPHLYVRCSNKRIVVLNCVRLFTQRWLAKTLYTRMVEIVCVCVRSFSPRSLTSSSSPSAYIHFHFISLSLWFSFFFGFDWTWALDASAVCLIYYMCIYNV